MKDTVVHANDDDDPMQGQECADFCYVNSVENKQKDCGCYCHLSQDDPSLRVKYYRAAVALMSSER